MTETQDGERLWHGDGDEHTEPECLNPDHFEDPPIPPRPDPELDRIATPTPDDRDREVERLRETLRSLSEYVSPPGHNHPARTMYRHVPFSAEDAYDAGLRASGGKG